MERLKNLIDLSGNRTQMKILSIISEVIVPSITCTCVMTEHSAYFKRIVVMGDLLLMVNICILILMVIFYLAVWMYQMKATIEKTGNVPLITGNVRMNYSVSKQTKFVIGNVQLTAMMDQMNIISCVAVHE